MSDVVSTKVDAFMICFVTAYDIGAYIYMFCHECQPSYGSCNKYIFYASFP